ncbi:hypothetical protein KMZ68_06325 [Bradyrhizobium sediminis]|uniref:Uncharacterized protein n=1 Tax=Bradyrhizobium sediminis TaxID=2840469 RepID=A0A975NSV3_9BRAD|nr:hypothetical protein [Bradyrhizobium sediminis]QWG19459.1 hypothetical protein KMZ68_06325 [Bradyrhizobium sediminis]
MAHLITSDDKYPDFIYDDAYRSYLITRTDTRGDYRFARTSRKRARVHARGALRRVNGFLKNLIEAIASSKLRRMERELELRGIRHDRHDWATRHPGHSPVRED